MKIILSLLVLLLSGCASLNLQPTSVNPGLTYLTNDLKAVTAAAGGDCTIVIMAPGTTAMNTDCSPLDPTTTTVATNGSTYQLCFGDAATSQVGAKVSAAALGLQTQLCANAKLQGTGVVTAPVVPAIKP